ncbi:hypothetical protein [Erythrobacter sp.]|jgi:hypothetical protein|uniref:hypothetical protein n=1 Tax=Erythrobacter sp. TaxID=1042 RepID=UPI002EC0FE23|nr:hypothetical protein [Erythrobacter sp.]
MSIHFAAAPKPGRGPACLPIARAMAMRGVERFANDNDGDAACPVDDGISSDHMLGAALRYFAQHGIRAAREARDEAETAFFAGDRARYDWWLGITRTLDRRLAAEAVTRLAR